MADAETSGGDDPKTVLSNLEQARTEVEQLRLGRSGTVVGSVSDSSPFMESIYVPDEIDDATCRFFDEDTPSGELFVLLGSAGDGKTAIFGRAFRRSDASWLDPSHINLDATESTSTTRSETEQLTRFLERVDEGLGVDGEPRRGLAINLGLALKYFRADDHRDRFADIWEAIDAARNPSNFDEAGIYRSGNGVTVANLSHRRLFDTHPRRLGEGLLTEIVDRFDYTAPASPFVGIADQIEDAAGRDPFAYNLKQFADSTVRESIVRLLAARAVISNQYLNPRRVLDYVSKILVPRALTETTGVTSLLDGATDVDGSLADVYLWNSTYRTLTEAGRESARLDPCTVFSLEFDEEILETWGREPSADEAVLPGAADLDVQAYTRTRVRMRHLLQERDYETEERSDVFEQFTAARSVLDQLNDTETGDGELRALAEELTETTYEAVITAIKRWSQQSQASDLVRVADGNESVDYQFLAEWEQDAASLANEESATRTTEETQLGKLWFVFQNNVAIPLSYELYRLLALINKGYNPNAVDPEESEGVRLLHAQLSRFTNKGDHLEVRDDLDQHVFELEKKGGWSGGIRIQRND